MKTAYITASLALIFTLTLPVSAGTKDDAERDHSDDSGGTETVTAAIPSGFSQDPVERFVEANVLETLYHEMAHALIDTMNLPIFGPEEYAADFFAAVLLDRVHDDATTRQLVIDVTRSYRADEQADRAAGVSTSNWDVHGKPMQRYYNLACLYYGGNPEERQGAIKTLNIPDGRLGTCVEEYEQAEYAWGDVLDTLAEGAPAQTITLDWILDQDSHLTQYVVREVDALNKMMALPESITVSVIPCGEVNAYYVPDDREIIICTELAEHLAEVAP